MPVLLGVILRVFSPSLGRSPTTLRQAVSRMDYRLLPPADMRRW